MGFGAVCGEDEVFCFCLGECQFCLEEFQDGVRDVGKLERKVVGEWKVPWSENNIPFGSLLV